ncbi:MAG TPA: radical SAM protein [Archaeoglobaceae archaeon]|nr:radical SAM protein [Archaeoglobaceae archaeon]
MHQTIYGVKKIMENPAVRTFVKKISSPGKIEKMLAIYAGEDKSDGIVEKAYSVLISRTIKKAAEKFNVDERVLKDGLKDVCYRKGVANVVVSIAEFGVTMPQRLHAPFLVVWNFTKRCNLKCKHCYSNAGKAVDELSLEERLNVIDQLNDAGVVAVSFSGGEPLSDPDFWKVAEYASEKGLHVSVATNGTLINEEAAKRLKEINTGYIEISLDAHTPSIHDEFRGVSGAFNRALRGIENCVKEGLLVGIATTATRLNVSEIPGIVDLAEEVGAHRLIVFNFVPTGRGKNIQKLDLTAEERGKLLEFLYDKLEEGKVRVFSTSPTYAVVAVQRVEKGLGTKMTPTHFADVCMQGSSAMVLADFIGGCGAGRLYCGIEPNGDITPCVFIPIVVGNVKDGFLKVWQQSEILEMLRDRDSANYACSDCNYRYICGGCRARAYGYYDNLLAHDPGCHIKDEKIKITRTVETF